MQQYLSGSAFPLLGIQETPLIIYISVDVKQKALKGEGIHKTARPLFVYIKDECHVSTYKELCASVKHNAQLSWNNFYRFCSFPDAIETPSI